jgi:signal transduction histidine kinase
VTQIGTALRRVATLVARGVQPGEIFLAVGGEIRRLLDADDAGLARFEPGGAWVVALGGVGDVVNLPVGTRLKLFDYLAAAVVWRTGRPAQVDEDVWSSQSDWFADALRELGIRSMVASPILVEGRLWGVVNAVSTRGPFPPGTSDRMADFTELVATAVGNAESRAELAASRARIVAAGDETRRRIERDLHDGTQQRLVSLGLDLRLAQSRLPAGLAELETEIGRIANELDVPAIARPPEPIEVAAYYVVSEALTNATKHAHASGVRVTVEEQDQRLHLSVRDDGAGGADPARGSGLIGLRDRVEALGGSLGISSPPGEGTLISVELPLQLH